jgi:mono/diheme cytochrome c family protein
MKFPHEKKALEWALLTALVSLGGAGLLAIGIAATPILEPVPSPIPVTSSPEVIELGRQYYEMSCSHCHGDDASGDDDGPDLHNLLISNAHIARSIKKGIKGQMPDFSKKYNDKQIAALTAFLRSLPPASAP